MYAFLIIIGIIVLTGALVLWQASGSDEDDQDGH